MNKQEQIEEMQVDLLLCLVFSKNGGVKCGDTAEALYDAGYRKLPEDSIVLSREESQALKKQIEYWEYEAKVARKYIAEVRKETAEKILDEVKDMFLNTSYNIDWIFNKLEELAKQFGVEIKE